MPTTTDLVELCNTLFKSDMKQVLSPKQFCLSTMCFSLDIFLMEPLPIPNYKQWKIG